LNIDLTEYTGFPLWFDPDSLEIRTAQGIRFAREPRYRREMIPVMAPAGLEPEGVAAEPAAEPVAGHTPHRAGLGLPDGDQVHYWNLKLDEAGAYAPLFDRRRLTLGLVLLPPGQAGGEYIKTHGHYHSPIPGTSIGYPEVYTHYYGSLYLLLQRRATPESPEPDDCVLYAMQPGKSILIPPGYAHIIINPSDQPGLIAGLYSPGSIHEYAHIDGMGGAAYYLLERNGREYAVSNPRYTSPPPLRRLDRTEGTVFAPPDPHLPLWAAFVQEPSRYDFLSDPNAARRYFDIQDQRL
jgi:glucose-6-phosphate isomerase